MIIPEPRNLLIGVVGPCAAGKSTLINGLKQMGISARHIAQEHSYVQDMWKRITNPDVLIFLDVSYPTTLARRNLDWRPVDLEIQQARLAHARQHASLYIHTDNLSPQEILDQVIQFIAGV